GQEDGLRSGTLNVPAIVGFGAACDIAAGEGLEDAPRQEKLRDGFESALVEVVPDTTINGKGAPRIPNTSSFRMAGAIADAVIVNAPGIEIATGSACSSSTMEPSHVMVAMGLDRDAANECLRLSIGRQTTGDDMEAAVSGLAQAARFIRSMEVHT
ncbi:MAG: aminotransferase class V-fold PLP-dependent enzyme, partial [Alphaproteobacteria bacterium]|nr:aminotransferase class V-fold PLP-dependent enzyme [Alphaproteobacteria bacterium]